ncbi:MAG: DUF3822 family protein [Flavisolibacter sp.]
MKTLFNIRSGREITEQQSLLLEMGRDYCSYAFWDKKANAIDRLQFISFEEIDAADQLSNIIDELGHHQFEKVIFCSAFPEAILTPRKYFENSYEMLDIIYDQPAQTYQHDEIPEWQMTNMYSVPDAFCQLIKNRFPGVQFVHAYTPAIKVYNGYVADSQLSVHFTPQHFRVLLKKDSALQLAQTYHYTSPLDIVYYLLNICYEFELEQSSVYIILSGLVEKDSALYTELLQYFSNLHFAHAPELQLPDNVHPHYFFTSLYNLAACVS